MTGVETSSKRISLDRLSSKVFEVFRPVSEVESVGNSWCFSESVRRVPPSALVLTVLL